MRETHHPFADIAASTVLPPTLWRLFVVIWLAFLFYPLHDTLAARPAAPQLLATLIGAALLIALYLWLAFPLPFRADAPPPTPASLRLQYAAFVLLTADVLLLTLLSSVDWLWFFMFVSIALGVRLPPRRAALAIAGLSALVLIVGWRTLGWLFAFRILLPVAAVGLGMIGVGWLVATIRELRAAREEIARLAVAEERLRFARDLHDLLGHSLSTITLKNELARSLVPKQPDRAVQELADSIGLARAALREVREAVSGYRQPTLAAELRSARALLDAANIACHLPPANTAESAIASLPPAHEAVLAWAVREGATNVVRYSGARHCTIQLQRAADTVAVEVIDDGRGASDPSDANHNHSDDPRRVVSTAVPGRVGTGLRGLAERAAQVGGEIDAGQSTPSGFRLRVAVPVAPSAPTVAQSSSATPMKTIETREQE